MDTSLGPLERYRSRGVAFHELILLPATVALEFVTECEQNEIRLLGVDAFEPTGGATLQSCPDAGLDVSTKEYWDYSVAELCDVVRDHIQSVSPHVLFEFLLPSLS